MSNITLKDVAKKAGVSFPTVSKVINNHDSQVAKSTKEKVLKVISELNYRPDFNARSLRSGKRICIGVLVNSTSSQLYETFTARILSGIGSEVDKHNYYMIFIPMGDDLEESIAKVAQSKMVDGLIINVYDSQYQKFCEQIVPMLKMENFPFVAIHSTVKEYPCHNVGYDMEQSGYVGTKHLIESGYKKISIICQREKFTHGELYQGYVRAMAELGFEINYINSETTDYSSIEGYEEGIKIIEQHGIEEAYVIYSDAFAYGFIQALKENDVSVPGNVGIVACNNITRDEVFYQTLTAVDRKYEERGEKAAKMLFDLTKQKINEEYSTYIAQPELIVRESTKIVDK